MAAEAPGAPAVSVVVLTWNRRELLAASLEAVLAQTAGDLEVLVIDNESTDGTEAFVTAHADPRVRYFRNANGGNLSVNRNYAVARARGRWIAFCDDDDLWAPGKLAAQLEAAAAHPDAGVVCSDAVYFSVDDATGEATEFGTLLGCGGVDSWLGLGDLLHGHNGVVLSSALVRREVFDRIGAWDTDPGIFAIEDYQYWIRCAAAGVRIRRLGAALLRYRVHAAMVSHADNRVTQRKQLYMIGRLHERGVLDDAAYAGARAEFRRSARLARVKHAFKRVPGLKAAVYGMRSRRHAAADARSDHGPVR
ncbi:MAG: glycosyltransferase family 2 protein [Actinobacteria bacterium]|nr:MAG: glycosyltransferase family 2 protein [Actinomycetota bacterium]